MDHLIANSENPIPPPDQQGGTTSTSADDVDEDDQDAVAAHIKKMGGTVNDADMVAQASDSTPTSFLELKGGEQSIKCSDCGKTFRSQTTASFHAERSGHQEFEESTEEVRSTGF